MPLDLWNAVADDKSSAFLDNAFLHNSMLDSGGDIGGDDYGFTPGLVGAWARGGDTGLLIGIDAGIFAVGSGADFSGSPNRPLSRLQMRFSPHWQLIQDPAGDNQAAGVPVIGFRASIRF